jgi:hypothetical protein
VTIPVNTLSIALRDVNGDGKADVAGAARRELYTLLSTATTPALNATPELYDTWMVFSRPSYNRVFWADLDGNGRVDLVASDERNPSLRVLSNTGGARLVDNSCASGDFYIRAAVPGGPTGPEVAPLLRQAVEAQLAALNTRADGLRSQLTGPALTSVGSPAGTYTVTLRDRNGLPVNAAAVTVQPITLPESTATFNFGPVTVTGPDTVTFAASAISAAGPRAKAKIRALITGGGRTDAASRDILVQVASCVADINGDGGVTIDDLLEYISSFEAGSPAADLDNGAGTGVPDGGVTVDDLLFFLTRFENGC